MLLTVRVLLARAISTPTPMMDYGLIGSNLALTVALFTSTDPYHTCLICFVALLVSTVTTCLVHLRVKADLSGDMLHGVFPVYDMGRLYSATLTTIAGVFTAVCVCLSTWLASSFCWWVAATMWVVDVYVLYETLEGGHDRIKDAEKKIKDGYIWKRNTWRAPKTEKKAT